jgi:hypothetical protein
METKTCRKCGIVQPLTKFRKYKDDKYVLKQCRSCEREYGREYSRIHRRRNIIRTRLWRHETGISRPMSENKKCSSYLGVYIAETILSKYFENVKRTKYGTKGYDFICKNGFKIDVKSSCFRNNMWQFHIRYNTTADYFLILAFNNRDELEPQHVWLIPGHVVNHLYGLSITNSPRALKKWTKYEKDLTKVIEGCDLLRK